MDEREIMKVAKEMMYRKLRFYDVMLIYDMYPEDHCFKVNPERTWKAYEDAEEVIKDIQNREC